MDITLAYAKYYAKLADNADSWLKFNIVRFFKAMRNCNTLKLSKITITCIQSLESNFNLSYQNELGDFYKSVWALHCFCSHCYEIASLLL